MGINLNLSWVLQMGMFPFIVLGFSWLGRFHKEAIDNCMKCILVGSFSLVIIQFFLGFNNAGIGFAPGTGTKALLSNLASFSNSGRDSIGMYKSLPHWLAMASFIYLTHKLSYRWIALIGIALFLLQIFSGVKSVLFGSLMVLLVISLRKINTLYRMPTVILLIITIVSFFKTKSESINEIMIFQGRYFEPVFSSVDFWRSPLGFGMGNYYQTAIQNKIIVDTHGYFASTWRNSGMSQFGMLPVPESDLLLFAVSYGWIFTLITLLFAITYLRKYVGNNNTRNLSYHALNVLGVFILFSGIFQDWFYTQFTWLFYGLIMNATEYKNYDA